MKYMDSLLVAVRDQIKTDLSLRTSQCDMQMGEKPPPSCGEIYVTIHPLSLGWGPSPDEAEAIDEVFTIGVVVTERTGKVPVDRMYRHLFRNTKAAGCLATEIIRAVRKARYTILAAANTNLAANSLTGKFVEPLRLTSDSLRVIEVGPDHFTAAVPKNRAELSVRDFGVKIPITFGRCRYMDSLLT